MLDFLSTHDYKQNLAFAFDCMKKKIICDLCLLGFDLNVYHVFHVLGVWFIFVRKFYVFGLIVCFALVSGQIMVFYSIQG